MYTSIRRLKYKFVDSKGDNKLKQIMTFRKSPGSLGKIK